MNNELFVKIKMAILNEGHSLPEQYPILDAELKTNVVITAIEEEILKRNKCPMCTIGLSPHRNCIMR